MQYKLSFVGIQVVPYSHTLQQNLNKRVCFFSGEILKSTTASKKYIVMVHTHWNYPTHLESF